jgi:hypothetical protein
MGLGEKNGGWGVGNEGSSGVSVDSCEGFLQSAKTQRYEEAETQFMMEEKCRSKVSK